MPKGVYVRSEAVRAEIGRRQAVRVGVKAAHYIPLPKRMASKTRRGGDDECWQWTGSGDGKGYGKINIDGRMVHAHRVAWQLANGPIPDGLHVLHTCDNRGCVNVRHLWLGTHQDNMRDRDHKRAMRQAASEAFHTIPRDGEF
jgi:hypothetical protein